MTLSYIGKGARKDIMGLYTRGYYEMGVNIRFYGTNKSVDSRLEDAEVVCLYDGFFGPQASHAEMYFLSIFGTEANAYNEGGLGKNERGWGDGEWGKFQKSHPRVDVINYIMNQIPSYTNFFNLPNYPQAPTILRKNDECEQELL
ncbi:hypothetical protein DICPUDRAFT_21784, partial [Dictyostelium purpureum]